MTSKFKPMSEYSLIAKYLFSLQTWDVIEKKIVFKGVQLSVFNFVASQLFILVTLYI